MALITSGCAPSSSDSTSSSSRCVVRDSNSEHQLLLPPTNWCPIFVSRTTQVMLETDDVSLQLLVPPERAPKIVEAIDRARAVAVQVRHSQCSKCGLPPTQWP